MSKIELKDYFPKLPAAIERKIERLAKIKYIKAFRHFMKLSKKCDKSFKKLFPDTLKELYIGEIRHHKRIYNIYFKVKKNLWGLSSGNDIYVYFDADKYDLGHYRNILNHELYHSYKRHSYNGNYDTNKWKEYKKYACIPIEFEAEGCAIGERIRTMNLKDFKKLENDFNNNRFKELRILCRGRYIEAWEGNVYLYNLFLTRLKNEINTRKNQTSI